MAVWFYDEAPDDVVVEWGAVEQVVPTPPPLGEVLVSAQPFQQQGVAGEPLACLLCHVARVSVLCMQCRVLGLCEACHAPPSVACPRCNHCSASKRACAYRLHGPDRN